MTYKDGRSRDAESCRAYSCCAACEGDNCSGGGSVAARSVNVSADNFTAVRAHRVCTHPTRCPAARDLPTPRSLPALVATDGP